MSRRKHAWIDSQKKSASRAGTPRFTRTAFALLALCALLLPGLASAEHRGSRDDHRRDRDDRYARDRARSAYAEYDRPGLYIGGGLVGGFTTRLESQLHEIPGVTNVEVDPSVGLTARAGVRVTPHIAIEAHYEWMDDFETSVAGNEIADTETQALTGDVKGYLATGRVQPYLAVGAGFLTAKSDDPRTNFQRTDTDFVARLGGGIEFYLNESVGFSVDTSYVLPAGDVKDLDYVSVGAGVFFRF